MLVVLPAKKIAELLFADISVPQIAFFKELLEPADWCLVGLIRIVRLIVLEQVFIIILLAFGIALNGKNSMQLAMAQKGREDARERRSSEQCGQVQKK